MGRVGSLDDAVDLVADGCRLGIGGVLMRRKPMALVAAIAARRRELAVHSFLGSIDIEWLVAHRAIAEADVGYVGFEQLGMAPAWSEAVAADRLVRREISETVFVGGLRAAGAGVPFWPSRGTVGSDLEAELGLEVVACPYTGEAVLAVPTRPVDVALIHAPAADRAGNVLASGIQDFLHDSDRILALAATTVIVSVEAIVERDFVIENNDRTLLFGHEVDLVVEVPGGAGPTELPGHYGIDRERVEVYLRGVAAGGDPRDLMAEVRP